MIEVLEALAHTCFRIVGFIFVGKHFVELYGSRLPHPASQRSRERKARHVSIGPLKTRWQSRNRAELSENYTSKWNEGFHLLFSKWSTYPVLLWALKSKMKDIKSKVNIQISNIHTIHWCFNKQSLVKIFTLFTLSTFCHILSTSLSVFYWDF